MKRYFVYILSNRSGTLYTGVTSDLSRRILEHQLQQLNGFTSKYNIHRLLYYEECADIRSAIAREKTIKGWRRNRKLALIRTVNPTMRDLSEGK